MQFATKRAPRSGVALELSETVQFAMKEHASKSSTPTLERKRISASYAGFHPASPAASRIAAKASRKRGTKCEVKLRLAVRKLGLRFTMNDSSLSGCPDLVFKREKVAIFADGDFWHGRKLAIRIATLSTGHNSSYWIQKIQSNVIRDKAVTRQLRARDHPRTRRVITGLTAIPRQAAICAIDGSDRARQTRCPAMATR